MRNLNEIMMRNLSFPDSEVEKMEFYPQEKVLKIFVGSAWLDVGDGAELRRGVLYFNEWDSLSISRFDPTMEKWTSVDETSAEPLKDLCEVKFSDSIVSLCGFGKQIGQWLEWKISNAKMHAEFEI